MGCRRTLPILRTPERNDIRCEDAFSLIELIVAISVTLIVAAAGLGLLEAAGRSEPRLRAENAKIQTAQTAMERVVRELRQTYTVSTPTPTASSLTVLTYLPRTTCGGSTVGAARQCKVNITCTAGTCTRTVSEVNGSGPSSQVIATGLISNSVFSYLPSTAAPTQMTVTFGLSQTPGSSEDAITLSDGVVFRNITGASGI